MHKRVATLEPNDHDTLPHPLPASAAAPGRVSGRFQYASGESPLVGYTIKRGVGQGGFGEIYYAVSDAGKEVALKLVRRNLEVELRGIRQCLNLKHPHLLDLYDIRQDSRGDTWVVMEYVADQCLEDVLASRPQGMKHDEALAWIRGIGEGVAYLHDRGIVHRDLKPGNIFTDEGVVKVGDYGLSKFISCSRRSGHTESIGTVHYMAPEVANGRYGKEIDVYALGVILYELLTGRVPFEGESIGEVLMKHLTAKPDVSVLPEPYRGVVARAMEKDPALRYASANEMLAALPSCNGQSLVFGHSKTARRPPVGETVVAAEPVCEEPVLRAVRQTARNLQLATQQARQQTPGIYLLVVVGVILATVYLWPVITVSAIILGIVYGIYRLFWTLSGKPSTVKETSPIPDQNAAARRSEEPADAILLKPARERLADLLGSMLGGALAAGVMCAALLLVNSYSRNQGQLPKPEQYAWLWAVSTLGCWAVLVPAKFWEGVRGDAILRRFLMMVLGMGIGVAASALSDVFLVGLPAGSGMLETPNFGLPAGFYGIDGRPELMAHAACFGTLFLLVRWWRQTNPLRAARLSLWSLIWTVAIAGIAAFAWQFPQPWLPMVAATISVSVQLASPWRFGTMKPLRVS